MAGLRDAEIVIVGGGAIGCAIAYRLTEAGRRDVLLIEKEPALASVTTAQAAGLVGQVRSSVDRVRLAMDSVATFRALQAGPEPRPAWREVGSLRIALEDARVARVRAPDPDLPRGRPRGRAAGSPRPPRRAGRGW